MKFKFILSEKAHYSVSALCEALEVSRTGFYAWCRREPSKHSRRDEKLRRRIRGFFAASRGTYGSPRILSDLADCGERVSRKRVARLMREESLRARTRKRFVNTTDSQHSEPVAPNLLKRDFAASKPNGVWVGDITYLPTAHGFVFLAVLIDLHSRRVVGWAMRSDMTTALPSEALQRALIRRGAAPRIHHTDQGIQYASHEYRELLSHHGTAASMSRRGNCWDNAVAESFFSTLKSELTHRLGPTMPKHDVINAVNEYIAFYNEKRRHSSVGYKSPMDFERAMRMDLVA